MKSQDTDFAANKGTQMSASNWRQNALTERLGVDLPIFLSPMGRLSTPELAASVSNSGGIGGMGMAGVDPAKLRERILAFRQRSEGIVNINFLLFQTDPDAVAKSAPMQRALARTFDELGLEIPHVSAGAGSTIEPHHIETLTELRPGVVSFHFGLPSDDIMAAMHSAGTFVISTATTVREACELEKRGADAVIVQGLEAGGHRGTFLGADTSSQSELLSLLPRVVDEVSIPVIAAGGIADGRGIAAALMLGASAVQMGTAFLLCPECGSSEFYRRSISSASEGSTIMSDRASGRPARFLNNEFIEKISQIDAPTAPFPSQSGLVSTLAASDKAWQVVYAGQSVFMSREVPAEILVQQLVNETDVAFSGM